MTREAVRQWHVSRTQSVAHTLALMDRDGLFNKPQDRSRSSTLGGNAATAVSLQRDRLKLTRSQSMPQQGSGRHETAPDMDVRDSEKRLGCHGADKPSPRTGHQHRPKSGATDDKSSQLDTQAVQQPTVAAPHTDAHRSVQTGHEVCRKTVEDRPQLNLSSLGAATQEVGTAAMASRGRQAGSLNRQVSDAASMSGRAYARAPSSDMHQHSDSGAVSGNGSVIIHNVPASVGGNALTEAVVSSEHLPQELHLPRQAESSAREDPQSSVSRQDIA